jgi:hypothetical protein
MSILIIVTGDDDDGDDDDDDSRPINSNPVLDVSRLSRLMTFKTLLQPVLVDTPHHGCRQGGRGYANDPPFGKNL